MGNLETTITELISNYTSDKKKQLGNHLFSKTDLGTVVVFL